MATGEIFNIYMRPWPTKQYTLFSMSDAPGAVHLQRGLGDKISILMRIEWKQERVTILELKLHETEEEAVIWYVEQKAKYDLH